MCKNERKYRNTTKTFIFGLSRQHLFEISLGPSKSHISETNWATELKFLHNIAFNKLFKKCQPQQPVKMKDSTEI